MSYINAEKQYWKLSGNFHIEEVTAILNESAQLPVQGKLAIDFANVEGVDSSAVALMLAWQRRMQAEKVSMQFINVPPNLKSLAKLYGLEAILLK